MVIKTGPIFNIVDEMKIHNQKRWELLMIPLRKNEPVRYNEPKPQGYKSNDQLIMDCHKGITNGYGLDYFRGLASELASRLAESEAKVRIYETIIEK
jgi:hypothetical protein